MTAANYVLAATIVLAASAMGCADENPNLAPAGGRVTLNGDPVEGAHVTFLGPGRPAAGATDADGRFKLTTFEPADGALAGTHAVIVTKEVESAAPVMRGGVEYQGMENVLPKKYSNPGTSELQFEVTAEGPNDFELRLRE